MNFKQLKLTVLIAAGITLQATLARAWSGGYEYDWLGGSPGYSGQIFMDFRSSDGGTPADIISAVIATPQGTFEFNPGGIYSSEGALTWNASAITGMWINWTAPSPFAGFPNNFAAMGVDFIGSSDAGGHSAIDDRGYWGVPGGDRGLSPQDIQQRVPEAPGTLGLFGLALAGLGVLRQVRRRATV